jgi:peroxiredoxin
MVDIGEKAPDFTAPMAGGAEYNDIEEFTLSEALGGGPIVLVFVPAAFTRGCTEEMCTFEESIPNFEALDAQVYGISVDLPFSQNIWMQEEDLRIPLLSDWEHEVIRKYDVVRDDVYGLLETAERSVFVIDSEGKVTYRWVRGAENPDFDELVTMTTDAVEEALRA